MMKYIILFVLSMCMLAVFGCSSMIPAEQAIPDTSAGTDYLKCAVDSDCICDGIDRLTGKCYLGNKDYYDKNVDTSKDCPDFCTGIAANLVVKCVDSKCIQVFECITNDDCSGGVCQNNKCISRGAPATTGDECKTDDDCVTQGCSGQLCMPSTGGKVMTTCEMRPEYECLRYTTCTCESGKCAWLDNPAYLDCMKKLK